MKYSFMTFSCPELTLDEALDLARTTGYDGIEPRLDAGHGHGIEVTLDDDQRAEVHDRIAAAPVALACLATSCRYADAPGETSIRVQDTIDRIDLAADLGAPAIRVFGGQLAEELSRKEAVALVADCLSSCAGRAAERGVTVCMETHDAWCDPADVAAVMQRVDRSAIGVNWDVMHPVRVAGATMDSAFATLRPWIRHLHIHDAEPGLAHSKLVPIGTGAYDHRRVIELLLEAGYNGYLSGEWIKWDDPYESHLPRELTTMRGYEAERGA